MKSAVKKEKGKVDLFGERYRARAHQLSPRLRAAVSYINDNPDLRRHGGARHPGAGICRAARA